MVEFPKNVNPKDLPIPPRPPLVRCTNPDCGYIFRSRNFYSKIGESQTSIKSTCSSCKESVVLEMIPEDPEKFPIKLVHCDNPSCGKFWWFKGKSPKTQCRCGHSIEAKEASIEEVQEFLLARWDSFNNSVQEYYSKTWFDGK